jgi:hypothetical protein
MTSKKKKTTPTVETITTFKGFDKDLKCRGFQYKVGETFKHDGNVKACESGFHACEYPLDVFGYYPPAGNRFAVVEQSGELSRHSDDSKVASKSISIKAEISIAGLVKAAIEYTTSRCNPVDPESPASATGTRGAASATGTRGAASATGDQGAASATGYQGAASATGTRGAASATGQASVAVSTGWEGRAQAADGCAIVLVFRDNDGNIVHIRASKVGENGIKAGGWYTLDDKGEFVEIKDEGDSE